MFGGVVQLEGVINQCYGCSLRRNALTPHWLLTTVRYNN